MQRGLQSYRGTSGLDAASPRENEIVAFSLCNARMVEAATPNERMQALDRNRQLWSFIVKDVSLDANGLPAPLKDSLVTLGVWSMAYSLKAMAQDLPVQPLIDVNQDIIDGLRAQAGSRDASVTVKTRAVASGVPAG